MQGTEKNHIEVLRRHYRGAGGLHHAYLFERSTPETRADVVAFLASDLGMATSGNPDLWSVSYESFGIDDARDLGERASRSPLGDRKVFILAMQFITVQAQNALLKVLEEPTDNTHFFIVMPNADVLLPTVRSRLMHIRSGGNTLEHGEDERARSFLAQDVPKRMAFLKNALEMKDKGAAVHFTNMIEWVLYRKGDGALSSESAAALQEVTLCRGYIYDTSASLKILLEHLALLLPQIETSGDLS